MKMNEAKRRRIASLSGSVRRQHISNSKISEMETDELKLLDFPNEVLLKIFLNLNDHSLLQAINVCMRFKIIAKAAFTEKYNGKLACSFYSLKISGKNLIDERKQYQQIFSNFGDNMTAIDIKFKDRHVLIDHWLTKLIRRYCQLIKKVKIRASLGTKIDLASIICHMPNITELSLDKMELLNHTWTRYTYPKLTHFHAKDTKGDPETFRSFISRNPQLEDLRLVRFIDRPNDLLRTVNEKLNSLKKLTLLGEQSTFTETTSFFSMSSLQELTVCVDQSFVRTLQAIRDGFARIEKLTVYSGRYHEFRIDEVNLLGSFQTLKNLEIDDAYEISLEHLQVLIACLPNLVSLSIGSADNVFEAADNLLDVVSFTACQKLSVLVLCIGIGSPSVGYNFCTRFAKIMDNCQSNFRLELVYDETDKLIFTREEARQIVESLYDDHVKHHRILYWNGYDASKETDRLLKKNVLDLGKDVLQKIVGLLDGSALYALFRTNVRLKQLVVEHVAGNVFHCRVTPTQCTEENAFIILGHHIQRIEIDMDHYDPNDDDDEFIEGNATHELKAKLMRCVNGYCNHLSEMKIKDSVQIKTVLRWPDLKKLEFTGGIETGKLMLFHCPVLTHLAIFGITANITNGSVNWANIFPNLMSLKISYYDNAAEAFLLDQNERICNQLKELFLRRSIVKDNHLFWLKLTNNIVRFGRLVTLDLDVVGIEEANYKYLFEHLSMLEELTVLFGERWSYSKKCLTIVRTIKSNCNVMKVLRLGFKGSMQMSKSTRAMIISMFPMVQFNNN